MDVVIQKFGGTSVSTIERRGFVVEKVKKAIEEGEFPVVVVSAMGRKGQPYATDTLLSLVSDNLKKNNTAASDMLLCCGEIISTVVMCDDLMKQGINCVPLTGGNAGIITDDNYNNANVLRVDKNKISELISQNIVPVVAGFQGITEDGRFTTIGRGGSDTTASLLGVALSAKEIQIYTDVDGIMTADPRIVDNANLINKISYSEVFQFADQGAKVIHPRAVEVAMRGNIPIVIKNTINESQGTFIDRFGDLKTKRVITGITHISGRVQVRIESDANKIDVYKELFNIIADNNISIDLISVFPKESVFTIDKKELDKFNTIMDKNNIRFTIVDNCSKIALIGEGMRGVPGVMASIIRVLNDNNIEVLQTADSHTTIWCLVNESDNSNAIKALHKRFMN